MSHFDLAVNTSKTSARQSRSRRALKALACLLVLTILAIFLVSYCSVVDVKDLTANLPNVDRIEIESVQANDTYVDKVLGTRTLTGSKAQEFTDIWRSQSYIYDISAACHEPGYRIRFYKNHFLITEATICFHCQNIYFYRYKLAVIPGTHLEATMGSPKSLLNPSNYKKLQDYLSNLFPGHDVETESAQKPN